MEATFESSEGTAGLNVVMPDGETFRMPTGRLAHGSDPLSDPREQASQKENEHRQRGIMK